MISKEEDSTTKDQVFYGYPCKDSQPNDENDKVPEGHDSLTGIEWEEWLGPLIMS